MKLDIILRIHDGKNIHGNVPRYINVSKKDLIIGCVSSLINSANLINNIEISFVILSDHCTQECLSEINRIFSYSKYPWKIIDLEECGFNHSALKQFEYCKNSKADLVYSVEDDYLHYPTAILEMVDTYHLLKRIYHYEEVCMFPFDTPQEYIFNLNEKFLVTRGKNRHWKSSTWTTQTFMTSPKVFNDHWHHFERLAKEFKVIPVELKHTLDWDNIVWEDTTICNIWKNDIPVFHPIPSLALHVQFQDEKDPYIDHEEWWYKYSRIKSYDMNYRYG